MQIFPTTWLVNVTDTLLTWKRVYPMKKEVRTQLVSVPDQSRLPPLSSWWSVLVVLHRPGPVSSSVPLTMSTRAMLMLILILEMSSVSW